MSVRLSAYIGRSRNDPSNCHHTGKHLAKRFYGGDTLSSLGSSAPFDDFSNARHLLRISGLTTPCPPSLSYTLQGLQKIAMRRFGVVECVTKSEMSRLS
jgi:hypothetical protein